jgi:PBSX family phage terminase large subunit
MSSFKKTATQRDAIDKITQSPAKNIMLYGSSRSGKTFLAVYILVVRACRETCSQIIVRNTFNSVKNSIWMGTLPKVLHTCFPNLKPEYDRTNYIVRFANGSTIRVAGLDDGEKLERLLGLECSGLLIEECNQVPFVAVERLKTRLAEKNNLRKLILYTQNPTKTTSAYYQAFEQKINPIDGEAMSPDQARDYLSLKMNIQGNLENVDKDYLAMLEKLPEKERKRFLEGEYDSENTGAAVYAFSDEHISDDAQKLPGTIYVGSDFNFMWNSDVISSRHAHGLYVWDEVQIEGDTFKKCDELKKKGAMGATVIADSTGANRRTSGKSDFIILQEAGFRVERTLNPAVVDKIANLNRCFTLGLIKINPRCKRLVRDLKQLTWDKHGQLDQKRDPSLSHLVDSLAYLCYKLFPLAGDASKYWPESFKR